ncbi:hypothetical protein Ocin01_04896 [Orchesella cincta]|uniref:Uncharacterized protein n=1 Tax=Orchesella cincta TaxID=48709 RepID=A0A1D2N956_ORCCI|nr:hypothetical protein Ocin01_04896 [Orchesella cincta]
MKGVVVVIGYGGGPSGSSDDEDDSPPDPLDSASVAEVMEKNSLTFEDKELHRMTQKNTNFNSIKTNLLGTTCIEIGPIVGCTGGKSMEGSSKPLVSIGTFETRKEPLRIHKKISEDSTEDELNEKTVEKHRKFIQRTNNSSTSTIGGKASSSQVPSKIASMPSSSNSTNQSNSSKELEIKQQTTTLSTSSSSSSVATKSILSTNNKATSSSSTFNSSTATTLNKMSVSSNKTSSSVSNKSASTLQTVDKGNGSSTNSTTTIEVNPEQTSSCDTTTNNAMRSSKECIAAISSLDSRGKSSSSSSFAASSTLSSHITTSSSTSTATSTLNKWGSSNNPSSTPSNNDGNPTVRNKPVLKRIQKANQSESSSISEQYTVNSAVVETISSNHSSSVGSVTNNTASLNSRNNLIILTSGDKAKVNGNNNSSTIHNGSASTTSLASKRTSFLRDIIVDSSSKSSTVGTTGGIKLDETSGSTTAGVQVICKNNEEQGSLMKKTELKVDLKPSVNNGKLSHPPFGECLSNRSNGTSDSSEFDDSLEDSGLDIKKCSEISESDEKSGSGSDSGNENDYSDRDRVKIIPTAGPKSGLFISVEEVEGGTKKPEKLSPDSVLFSSASEMSASGSSESIPEALDTVSNGSSQKSSSGESGTGATSAAAAIKRAAPRPPQNNSTVESRGNSNAIYANTQTNVMQVEGLYDDVSFYKNPMHFPSKGDKISAFEEEDEEEEENIYDDCTTITAIPKGGIKPGSKSAIGSYNFQNGSRSALDSDGDEEAEKVVHRRSDGIEFIGIRKIDSESFLRERSPTPERSPDGKRERSSSASPKTRRKVNQFFSTIGKKAGAAFSQHVHGYGKNKGSPPVDDSIEKSPSGNSSAYKRSLSTDEVSMTRTQEIYATLTPTSLKFKGLAPVLHKLSKMDLHMGDNKGYGDGDDDRGDSKEKGYKKHKISSSIKKFLRFGSKDGGESSGHKYDFGSGQNKTEMNGPMISSQITEEQTDSSPSRTPTPTTALPLTTNQQVKVPERKPSCGTLSGRPPPPPPPRVHSLDLLNRVGVVGPNGTVRPARPPPPARHNRVAPSFTSVFTNPNAEIETKPNVVTNNDGTSSHPSSNANNNGNGYSHHYNTPNGDAPDPNNPPSKPKRKASMNLECVTSGISRQQDLETTYNHITTLNLETLKLIASQTPTKIRRSNTFSKRNSSSSHPLKWSQFHVPESSKPLIHGHGFVFYSAFLDDESCVLLVQESATAPNFSAPFEFPCVETSATFEDFIPSCYVTWQASEYVTNGSNVKVFVSVMPKYNMYTVENYMRHSQVPLLHKYFALLQAMNYWDKEEMSDLLVLVQSMEESDSHFLTNSNTRGGTCDIFHQPSSSPSSVLVYVHPVPSLSKSNGAAKRTSSRTQLYTDFENSMKQILLNNGSDGSRALLGDNDRHVLFKRLNENKAKTVQEQFRLFLQVKLFAPKRDSGELEQIKKLKSERAIQQWLDKERALCMKEAVEQTLQRNIESSISPYKRSYLEFLLTPENSAKAVLDMLIDLLE